EALMKLADGVKLGTLNHPDSSPTEDETFIRDVLVTRVTGGRKRKRQPGELAAIKERWFDPANGLRRVMECTLEDIRYLIYRKDGSRVSKSAVRKWCVEGGSM